MVHIIHPTDTGAHYLLCQDTVAVEAMGYTLPLAHIIQVTKNTKDLCLLHRQSFIANSVMVVIGVPLQVPSGRQH